VLAAQAAAILIAQLAAWVVRLDLGFDLGAEVACVVPELGLQTRPGLLRSSLVFVEEAAGNGPALDLLLGEAGGGVAGRALSRSRSPSRARSARHK
jgi:hypothetical protein